MLRWSANSCFLDSLLLLLLKQPSRYVREHMLSSDDPLSHEMARVERHIAEGGMSTMTSDRVRELLPRSSTFESFNDGQPHECSEVLLQLLAHFRCPDTLETTSVCSVLSPDDGAWYQRRAPERRAEAPVWVVSAAQLLSPAQRLPGSDTPADGSVDMADLLVLREQEQLDEPVRLDPEDRAEIARCCAPGGPGPAFESYTTRRLVKSTSRLSDRGDIFFVDIRRTFLHPRTFREMRASTPVRVAERIELAGRELCLGGLVIHAMQHYVVIVRDGSEWVLLDDQHPDRRERLTWAQLQKNTPLMRHVVLLSYVVPLGSANASGSGSAAPEQPSLGENTVTGNLH